MNVECLRYVVRIRQWDCSTKPVRSLHIIIMIIYFNDKKKNWRAVESVALLIESLRSFLHKPNCLIVLFVEGHLKRWNVWRRIFDNYSLSPNGLWINSPWGRTQNGYWLRGHEGERNNCFSKIQLVGQKNIETKHLSQFKTGLQSFFAAKTLQIWRALFSTSGL